MNKTLLSLSLVLVMALVSCSKNSPEASAKKWLNAYYTFQIDEATEYSSEDTKSFMEMIKGMLAQNPIPDTMMNMFKETKVDIHSKDIKITGDSATVPYTLTMPEASQVPPLEKTLKMVKKDGKWLAQYTMMDAMAENQQATEQMSAKQGEIQESEDIIEAADSAMQQEAQPEATEEVEDAAKAAEEAVGAE